MAIARILVDGYSLLHSWPELAPGQPRHAAAARDELVRMLTRYHDVAGTPISLFFDGQQDGRGLGGVESTPEVEVLYSRTGQTADEMIERVTHRLLPYGEVLVVTDDYAERDTVIGFGGMASSCLGFIQTMESALDESQRQREHRNRKERQRFERGQ